MHRAYAKLKKQDQNLTFGYLSVVVIPMAAGRIEFFCKFFAANGTPSPVMAATGKRHPIIPAKNKNNMINI